MLNVVHPGDLRRRITIQKNVPVRNSTGVWEDDWQDVATVKARVRGLRGREYAEASATQAEKITEFTIRYRTDVEEDMRIVYQDKHHRIVYLDDIESKRMYLMIHAEAVVPGG